MDAPLEVERLLGVEPGGAHVLRNAGGVPSDDVIRSLCLAQRLLGIRAPVVVHRSDCRLDQNADDCAAAGLAAAPEVFRDVDGDVRVAVARIECSPLLELIESMRGLVFEDASGRLRDVASSARERAA